MAKFKVIHEKDQCISCGACAAISPDHWKMDDDGLAHLKGSSKVEDHWEKEIDSEVDRADNQEAADCCPVNIIHVKPLEKKIPS
jgi:ferredoxin